MNEIWANRLIAETRSWENVPDARRPGVKAALAARVAKGAITAAEYKKITGEKYKGG